MGLADLHIHTTYSWDGVSTLSAVLKHAAHACHLDVIAITDHDCIEGALEALELAPMYGIEVIPGVEVSSKEGHVLALFVHEIVPANLSLEETVLWTTSLGGICIIPHPMMNSQMSVSPLAIRRALLNPDVREGLVGVETFNGGLAGAQHDRTALSLVQQMPLARVGSSDAHIHSIIGVGVTSFSGASAAALREELVLRRTTAIGRRSLQLGDYMAKYVPRLAMRYAGWVSWNAAPSAPVQLARQPIFRQSSRSIP